MPIHDPICAFSGRSPCAITASTELLLLACFLQSEGFFLLYNAALATWPPGTRAAKTMARAWLDAWGHTYVRT